ncbi:hypothetical protein [Vibrio campbellii]|uniref:hypothetical protein n=1 Tax=Vibrio campbellii TaxID=680 RepID=UPI001389DA58|nr:hypothetical protein [Vibrio campbellii]
MSNIKNWLHVWSQKYTDSKQLGELKLANQRFQFLHPKVQTIYLTLNTHYRY